MTLEQDVKNSHFSFFCLVGEDKTPDKNCKLVSNQVTNADPSALATSWEQPNVANIYLFYLLTVMWCIEKDLSLVRDSCFTIFPGTGDISIDHICRSWHTPRQAGSFWTVFASWSKTAETMTTTTPLYYVVCITVYVYAKSPLCKAVQLLKRSGHAGVACSTFLNQLFKLSLRGETNKQHLNFSLNFWQIIIVHSYILR